MNEKLPSVKNATLLNSSVNAVVPLNSTKCGTSPISTTRQRRTQKISNFFLIVCRLLLSVNLIEDSIECLCKNRKINEVLYFRKHDAMVPLANQWSLGVPTIKAYLVDKFSRWIQWRYLGRARHVRFLRDVPIQLRLNREIRYARSTDNLHSNSWGDIRFQVVSVIRLPKRGTRGFC